jgi:group I intron endonuclease
VKQTGVYQIRCTVNGKVYVGSAARSFKDRWKSHRTALRGGRHCNRYLQFAWIKHGEGAFEFTILEECEPALCIAREQYWIDRTRAAVRPFGYNISPTAGSPLGVRHTPEARARVAAAQLGRKYGPEFSKAVSEGLKGKRRAPFSDEWRRRLSESKKGKPKPESFRRMVSESNRRRFALRRQILGIGEKPPSCIGATINCAICGNPFMKGSSQVKTCSLDCRKGLTRLSESRKNKQFEEIACEICARSFKPTKSNMVTCGPPCQRERECRRKREAWAARSKATARVWEFAFTVEP